jgi:hypothetical protein
MFFLKKQTAETRINTGFAGILPVCLCFFLIIMRKKYINIYNRAKKSRQTGRDSFSHVCRDLWDSVLDLSNSVLELCDSVRTRINQAV